MTIYYLYVKTHRTTGLQYLGYTSEKDPHKYKGSGKYWMRHLKKHGCDYDTKLLHRCISKLAIKAWGSFYSQLWVVSKSNKWANLVDERGGGASCFGKINGMYGKTHSKKTKKILANHCKKRFTNKSYEEIYGNTKANKLKKERSKKIKEFIKRNPDLRSGSNNPNAKIYMITDVDGNTFHVKCLKDFCKQYRLSYGMMGDIARNPTKNYKGYKITSL